MTRLLAFALVLAAAPAAAQTFQPGPYDQHRWQMDRHRLEMDRLRAGAERRETQARQQALEARLNRMDIEARRAPDLYLPQTGRTLRSPEAEAGLRRSATERRQATAAGVGEIDAWLDRTPD